MAVYFTFKKEYAVKGLKIFSSVLFFSALFVVLVVSPVQAQEDKRGILNFKLGGNSNIASSPLNARFNLGFGGGYQLSPKVKQLYVGPSLTMNMPQREVISLGGFPLQVSTKTILLDVNGTYAINKPSKRVLPYVTGGVGFLRNSASITDGYSNYSLGSDTHFTKNAGGGVRVFLKESFFVGVESRKYFVKGGNFQITAGVLGFTF